MEDEYGKVLGSAVNWVSSLWGGGKPSFPQNVEMLREPLLGPESRINELPEDGIRMLQSPVQDESAQLDSLEENVDALEDLDEFGGDAFDEWIGEIEEDVDWLTSSAVPEVGTDAYEIELVSREVALGNEMGLDAAEGGLNAAEAAQAALNVAEDSAPGYRRGCILRATGY